MEEESRDFYPGTQHTDDVDLPNSRRTTRVLTDNKALEVALVGSSLFLWVPYLLAAVYVAYCNSFFVEYEGGVVSALSGTATGDSLFSLSVPTFVASRLSQPYNRFYYYFFPVGFDIATFIPAFLCIIAFSAAAMGSTFYFAVRSKNGGEYLMILAWLLGVLSESGWLVSTVSSAGKRAVHVAPAAQTTAAPQPASSSAAASPPMKNSRIEFLDYHLPTPPGWLWLVVSIITGTVSGALCKVKDVMEGKASRSSHLFSIFDHNVVESGALESRTSPLGDDVSSALRNPGSSANLGGSGRMVRRRRSIDRHIGIGERLYMVVPLCTGQWFHFIVKHGWRGIVLENCTIVLSLGMVGYTMLSYKLLRRQLAKVSRHSARRVQHQHPSSSRMSRAAESEDGTPLTEVDHTTFLTEEPQDGVVDVIELIAKLFTTSFGVVVLVVFALNVFLTSLAIPFLKVLFSLNALVSSVGIIFELIVYDVV